MSQPSIDHSIATSYERFFVPTIGRPVAIELLRVAALRPGERVLDVGCGTGIVTRLAAAEVVPDGSVVGLDPDPGMLAVARTPAAGEEIEWIEAGAESMPLPDEAFDVVLCQMSLQFVPEPARALAEMHRVLTPGGRLVLNVPGPISPVFGSLAGAMERHIAPEAAGFVTHVFSLHDTSDLARLLEEAGFREVSVEADTKELRLPAARDFLWQYIGATPLAPIVAEVDDDALAALESDVLDDWRDLETDAGMECVQRFVVATGRRGPLP